MDYIRVIKHVRVAFTLDVWQVSEHLVPEKQILNLLLNLLQGDA